MPNNFTEVWKKRLKENQAKITLVAVGTATLVATYYYGKSKGEHNFNFEIFTVRPLPDGSYEHIDTLAKAE